MSKKTTPLIISGQKVQGSIYGMLIKYFGGGPGGIYNAQRAMYKARNAKSIERYLIAGIRKGYIGQLSTEQEYNKSDMENWIRENLKSPKAKQAIAESENTGDVGALSVKMGLQPDYKKLKKKLKKKITEKKSHIGLYQRMFENDMVYSYLKSQWVPRQSMKSIGGDFILPEDRI